MHVRAIRPILIVEDSPEDYETILRAFKKAGLADPIFRCKDGDEAFDFLLRRGTYSDPSTSPRPGIILLDLNLPGTDGREVLREIKSHPALKSIPVVILTTSMNERDIEQCYQDGANSYIAKPVGLAEFFKAIQRLTDYWLEIVILPEEK